MQRLWEAIKGYVWWTYPRGSVHYDVMVTIILLFIFLTPRAWFKDKPVQATPHQTEVVIHPDGANGFVYEVDASAIRGGDDASVREDLLRVIEPIAGEVEISSYRLMKDSQGHSGMYEVRVHR